MTATKLGATVAISALLLAGCMHSKEEVMVEPAPMEQMAAPAAGEAEMMKSEGEMMESEGEMMKSEGEMMKSEGEMMAPASDAASNCVANGGSLTMWPVDGADSVEACRREDGVEYRLSDAAYFEG